MQWLQAISFEKLVSVGKRQRNWLRFIFDNTAAAAERIRMHNPA